MEFGVFFGFKAKGLKQKKALKKSTPLNWWDLRDSNPRPPACKAGALNQLS